MNPFHSRILKTPVGALTLVANETHLIAVLWEGESLQDVRLTGTLAVESNSRILDAASEQLQGFFEGRRLQFDLPIRLQGTEFQVQVWEALRGIPYGETWSYSELAQRIARPKAMRAVGAANGRNRIPIVVPCHRVIGSSGALTGFAGGLEAKVVLLGIEVRGRPSVVTFDPK